jgi:Centrosome-associated C terminus
LRSKSDISDRRYNRQEKPLDKQRSRSESLSELEKFFDRLGLDDVNYKEHIAPSKVIVYSETEDSDSSAVFFSDVSTVDSTKLPDSTEVVIPQSIGNASGSALPALRPSEPTSIIERNARIIKWLCNCRKLQLT